MPFVKKLVREKAGNIFLVQGLEYGELCYCYVLVDSNKVAGFAKLSAGDNVDISKFGKVIKSGYDEPTADIKAEMEQEYGFVE